ncbi:hypothetical protein SLEP1_g56533 [Rubroshorea leprosula]|uniref:Uncharacterized protein n=1 Tax=Rubroshorea leprosula TaxID=152421 RepID=A0AAV5MJW2_9ROSI|nr:hypothetical protein SLEP1_g56533 [Rubroshorea leprosula]
MFSYENLRQNRESGSHESRRKPMWSIIALIAILLNEAVQNAACTFLLNNLVIYMITNYHMTPERAADIVVFWNCLTGFSAILWALIADSRIGRFPTVSIASLCSLLGMFCLWITAVIPKPEWVHCNPFNQSCRSPTAAESTLQVIQLSLVSVSLALISIGVGVRCSVALGADQIETIRNSAPQRMRIVERYFMFYFAASFLTIVVSFTVMSEMLDQYGWRVGFGVPTVVVFIFVVIFFACSPLYFKEEPKEGLFTRVAQVVAAAFMNRKLTFPDPEASGCYLSGNDSNINVPSDNIRFLNKACLITNSAEQVAPDGSAANPWRLCTVQQVEELKALLRVLPIWTTGIMMWVNASELPSKLLQAGSMERPNPQKLKILRAVFPIIGVSTMLIWGILYDRVILPLASKIKGKPVRLCVEVRMGIGLTLSCLAMTVSAILESVRQQKVMQNQNLSIMWLWPQYCLHGLAQGFTAAGQTEFFYSELPNTMTSIAVTLLVQGITVANWLSGVLLTVASDLATKRGKAMTSNDMSQTPLRYLFWFLAAASFINIFHYLITIRKYGPLKKSEENGAELAAM